MLTSRRLLLGPTGPLREVIKDHQGKTCGNPADALVFEGNPSNWAACKELCNGKKGCALYSWEGTTCSLFSKYAPPGSSNQYARCGVKQCGCFSVTRESCGVTSAAERIGSLDCRTSGSSCTESAGYSYTVEECSARCLAFTGDTCLSFQRFLHDNGNRMLGWCEFYSTYAGDGTSTLDGQQCGYGERSRLQ